MRGFLAYAKKSKTGRRKHCREGCDGCFTLTSCFKHAELELQLFLLNVIPPNVSPWCYVAKISVERTFSVFNFYFFNIVHGHVVVRYFYRHLLPGSAALIAWRKFLDFFHDIGMETRVLTEEFSQTNLFQSRWKTTKNTGGTYKDVLQPLSSEFFWINNTISVDLICSCWADA